MPLAVTTTTGGVAHAPVFIEMWGTGEVKADLSDLSDEEVDADGFLKPGVPFKKDGNLIGSGDPVFGVSIGGEKVATGGTDAILDAATDCFVVVGFGYVNRDVAEDNLGRAYSADEIAGFDLAGSNCTLSRT